MSHFLVEVPVEIVAELTEQHVEEHKASYFTCEVNKADVTVTWLKNSVKIAPSDKHQLIDEGTTHTLVIMDTDKSDVAEYSVIVGDQKSSAQLHLDGMYTRIWLVDCCYIIIYATKRCMYCI